MGPDLDYVGFDKAGLNNNANFDENTPLTDKLSKCSTAVRKRSRSRQIFAAFAANLGGFALGTVLSWTSPALPALRFDHTTFPSGLGADDESWIGSIVPLGAALGGPIGGYLTDAVGRRTCMCILTFPFIVGWVGICLAHTVPVIVAGRFLTGVCAGGFSLVAPIFVSEISDPSIRGWLAAGFELMVCVGILFMNVLGAYTPWRVQALVPGIVPTAIFFLMLFVPESPLYLQNKGRAVEARKAISWYQGSSIGHNSKVDKFDVDEELAPQEDNSIYEANARFSFDQLFRTQTLKPFAIALALVIFNELSAIDVVTFYTVDLFSSAGVSIDSYWSSIVVCVVEIAGATVAAVVVDKCGRRFLLLLSQGFIVIALGSLSTFFYLRYLAEEFTTVYLCYLPLISLVVYSFAYVVGLGTVIYMVMGEILPHATKGVTSGTITVCKWVLGFAVTKSFDGLLGVFGNGGVFAFYTVGSLVGLLYTAKYVPETSGKTLEAIQTLFH